MQVQTGVTYLIKTAYRPEGFRFKCLAAGPGATVAVGYMDDSASWPRSVALKDITSVEPTANS